MDAMNRAATNYAVMATIDFRGLSRIVGWVERGYIHRLSVSHSGVCHSQNVDQLRNAFSV